MKKKLLFVLAVLFSFVCLNINVYANDEVIPENPSTEQQDTVTLTYNANGGENAPDSAIVSKNTQLTVSEDIPTKKGYNFLGWDTNVEGTTVVYNSNDPIDMTEDITLYAVWSKTKYIITYELDGGTNSENNKTSYYITTSSFTLEAPTKKGFTFAGWYTDEEYTTKIEKIKKGSTGDKTLYAKWIEHKYTIVFNGNGATSGSMSKASGLKYSNTYKLSSNKFKKTGYTFVEWNTKADGSGNGYSNKGNIKKMSSKNGATVTLYAIWTKTKYYLTYELNGGTNSTSNKKSYYYTTSTFSLYSPTKKGYTFKGWYLDSEYTTKISEIKKGSTGDKTLYAKWSENKYTIAFNGNGATSGSMSKASGLKYSNSYKLSSNKFQRNGYEFIGWNTKADGSGNSYSNKDYIKKMSSKNGATVTLYAMWNKLTYTISYELNGGTNSEENRTSYHITKATFDLYPATKKGYKFKGWYTDAEYKKPIEQVKKGSYGDLVLYAKWSKIKYTITYELNGGKNSADNVTTYSITSNVSLYSPTKKGYIFDGWYSDAEFINKIDEITKGSYGNKTIYAKWIPITYFIAFSSDYATSGTEMETITCTYDEKCKLPDSTIERDGFIFGGWNTKPDGTGTTYGNGVKVKNLKKTNGGTATLYPYWRVEIPSFQLENIRYDNIQITITPVPNADGYVIYRSDNADGGFKKIANISGTTFNDTDISYSTKYYAVRAYHINEYGKTIFSKYTEIVKWKNAKKPKVAGRVTNTLGYSWYNGYLYLENRGSKDLYILNFALVYPYEDATYSEAYDPRYTKLNYVSLSPGYYTEFKFSMDSYGSRPFYDGAHITITMKYDGCEYFFIFYENGKGYFI